MNLCELRPAEGSRGKNWRRGRGHATGNGKTAGRGHKGAGQRSGTSGKCGFEGGQMPLYRRLPKRGFTCRNSKEIVAINVSMLNVFDNDTVIDEAKLPDSAFVNLKKGEIPSFLLLILQ